MGYSPCSQDAEILVITRIQKIKQLRHEPYPSWSPPLGTSFLSCQGQTFRQYFFVQSQDTFIQHCVWPTSTPTIPAVLSSFFPPPHTHTRTTCQCYYNLLIIYFFPSLCPGFGCEMVPVSRDKSPYICLCKQISYLTTLELKFLAIITYWIVIF